MQFDSTVPLDSVLVSELPEEIRSMKSDLGVVVNQVDVPLTALSAGEVGNYAVNTTHVYFYIGDGVTHAWVRAALFTW